jgi:hypothetical protein
MTRFFPLFFTSSNFLLTKNFECKKRKQSRSCIYALFIIIFLGLVSFKIIWLHD